MTVACLVGADVENVGRTVTVRNHTTFGIKSFSIRRKVHLSVCSKQHRNSSIAIRLAAREESASAACGVQFPSQCCRFIHAHDVARPHGSRCSCWLGQLCFFGQVDAVLPSGAHLPRLLSAGSEAIGPSQLALRSAPRGSTRNKLHLTFVACGIVWSSGGIGRAA